MTRASEAGRPAPSGKLAPVEKADDLPFVTPAEWIKIVDRIQFNKLGPAAKGVAGRTIKAVAYRVAWFAEFRDGTRVFPGPARLAVIFEADYKTTKKAYSVLRDLGLLTQTAHASGPRGVRERDADEYRLTIPADLLDRVHILDPGQMEKEIERVREANRRKVTGQPCPRNEGEIRGQEDPVTEEEAEGVTGQSRPGAPELRGNPVRSYGVIPSAIPTSDLPTAKTTNHDHSLELPLTPREGPTEQDQISPVVPRPREPPRRLLRGASPCGNSFCHGGVLKIGINERPCPNCPPPEEALRD